jgi:hypothetical protein
LAGTYGVIGEETLQGNLDAALSHVQQISVVASEPCLLLQIHKKDFVRRFSEEVGVNAVCDIIADSFSSIKLEASFIIWVLLMTYQAISRVAEYCRNNPSRRELLRHLEDLERWRTYQKMIISEATKGKFTFHDEDTGNTWRKGPCGASWFSGRPDPDAGSNHLLQVPSYEYS